MWRQTVHKALDELASRAMPRLPKDLQSEILGAVFDAYWGKVRGEPVGVMRDAMRALWQDLKDAGDAMLDERLTAELEGHRAEAEAVKMIAQHSISSGVA